jgi:hypothetical protein
MLPAISFVMPVEALPDDMTLPVTFNVPPADTFIPCADDPAEPAVTLPVTFRVPVLLCIIPLLPVPALPPVIDPTTVADEGATALKLRVVPVVVDKFTTFAVSVISGLRIKLPEPTLLIESHVVFTLIVIVCPVLARASSPIVGTTPPTHVAPALKLPVAADSISAI